MAELALTRDFQQFYQLDFGAVWRSQPRRALELIGGLYEISHSRYAAVALSDGSFGWTTEAGLLADVDDTLLSIIAGLSGRKLQPSDMHWRPKAAEEEQKRPRTIAEFDVAWFMTQL